MNCDRFLKVIFLFKISKEAINPIFGAANGRNGAHSKIIRDSEGNQGRLVTRLRAMHGSYKMYPQLSPVRNGLVYFYAGLSIYQKIDTQ